MVFSRCFVGVIAAVLSWPAAWVVMEQPWDDGPPGPMPVVHARPGEEVTFHCYAYSPCADVTVEDPDGGAKSYLISIVRSELHGGFGVTANGLKDVPRENWYMQCAEDTWCLGGSGFQASETTQKFAHQVPYGTASNWTFNFSPLSGQKGGDVTVVVAFCDHQAPVPAWASDGPCASQD